LDEKDENDRMKEKKDERMYIDDDLTKEERETQKKLGELAREVRYT
jgi:hypothetical protein